MLSVVVAAVSPITPSSSLARCFHFCFKFGLSLKLLVQKYIHYSKLILKVTRKVYFITMEMVGRQLYKFPMTNLEISSLT